MILNVQSQDRYNVINYSKETRPLSENEILALKAELANERYNNTSLVQKHIMLNEPYSIPNPEPQGKTPRGEWARDELYNALLQMTAPVGYPFFIALEAMEGSDNPQAVGLAKMVWFTLNGPLVSINLQNPQVAQAMMGLKLSGLLSQEQYDFITLVDAEYAPYVTLDAPVVAICGEGCVLSLAEVEGLVE